MAGIVFQFKGIVFVDNIPWVLDVNADKPIICIGEFGYLFFVSIREPFGILLKHDPVIGFRVSDGKLFTDILKAIESLREIDQAMTGIPIHIVGVVCYPNVKHSHSPGIKVVNALVLASPPKRNKTPQWVCGS